MVLSRCQTVTVITQYLRAPTSCLPGLMRWTVNPLMVVYYYYYYWRKGGGRWWWQTVKVIRSAQWTGNTIPVWYYSYSQSFTWFRDEGMEKHEEVFLTIRQRDKISHTLQVWCACKIQPNPNRVSLFTQCDLWWYIEGCSKLQYYVIGNFCSYAFRGTKWGWQCIGFWMCIQRTWLQ
jgi:hypothetical protein